MSKPREARCTTRPFLELACIFDSKVCSLHFVLGCAHFLSGTAIYLYGTTNCTYTVTLDSQSATVPLSLPFGLLFYQEGLTPTTHSVQLTAQPQASSTQMLGFDQAVFTNTIDQE